MRCSIETIILLEICASWFSEPDWDIIWQKTIIMSFWAMPLYILSLTHPALTKRPVTLPTRFTSSSLQDKILDVFLFNTDTGLRNDSLQMISLCVSGIFCHLIFRLTKKLLILKYFIYPLIMKYSFAQRYPFSTRTGYTGLLAMPSVVIWD